MLHGRDQVERDGNVTNAGVAEVAVEVVDDHHGLGIGSALVDAVTTVAAAAASTGCERR